VCNYCVNNHHVVIAVNYCVNNYHVMTVVNYCVNNHHIVTIVFGEVSLKTGTESVPKIQYIIFPYIRCKKIYIFCEFEQYSTSTRVFIKRDMKLLQS
jgi:hypothetical protein